MHAKTMHARFYWRDAASSRPGGLTAPSMGALTARPPVAMRMVFALILRVPPPARLTSIVCGSTNSPQPSATVWQAGLASELRVGVSSRDRTIRRDSRWPQSLAVAVHRSHECMMPAACGEPTDHLDAGILQQFIVHAVQPRNLLCLRCRDKLLSGSSRERRKAAALSISELTACTAR